MKNGSKWPEVRIGDLGAVHTGRTPSTKRPEYFGETFPFITPGDMHQGKRVRVTSRSLSPDGARLLDRIRVPAKSVCGIVHRLANGRGRHDIDGLVHESANQHGSFE